MRSISLFIVCLLFISAAKGNDSLSSFHGSKFLIPKGFREFSKEELKTFKSSVFNREIMTVYEKRTGKGDLQRMIIYYDSLSETTAFPFKKTVDIKREVMEEGGISFLDIEVNEKQKYAFGKIILMGDTAVFGFSVDAFGIMGIQIDNSKGIKNSDLEQLQGMLQTIKHQSPYYFKPVEDPDSKKHKKEMKNNGVFLVSAFLVMVVVWLARRFLYGKK